VKAHAAGYRDWSVGRRSVAVSDAPEKQIVNESERERKERTASL
jgi:hypothetical protein